MKNFLLPFFLLFLISCDKQKNTSTVETNSITVDTTSVYTPGVTPYDKDGNVIDTTSVMTDEEIDAYINGDKKPQSEAIYKMSKIFQGNPSEDELKDKLDRCIKIYGFQPNEENYNKFGSVLISLVESDSNHYTELELLECITDVRSRTPKNVQLKFADTAANCSVTMSSK
jgi:hypothetical protein